MMMPWLLIILGTIFLLENLNLIPVLNWSIIWPVILILAGLYMMKKKSGDSCCGWHSEKSGEEKK
ncbi:MAG: DUF5668 domain-containing protein [bacterium]|nr:DUF5668 domain-containing protein [bacterium]